MSAVDSTKTSDSERIWQARLTQQTRAHWQIGLQRHPKSKHCHVLLCEPPLPKCLVKTCQDMLVVLRACPMFSGTRPKCSPSPLIPLQRRQVDTNFRRGGLPEHHVAVVRILQGCPFSVPGGLAALGTETGRPPRQVAVLVFLALLLHSRLALLGRGYGSPALAVGCCWLLLVGGVRFPEEVSYWIDHGTKCNVLVH